MLNHGLGPTVPRSKSSDSVPAWSPSSALTPVQQQLSFSLSVNPAVTTDINETNVLGLGQRLDESLDERQG